MVKKLRPTGLESEDESSNSEDLKSMLQAIIANQQELKERLDEFEEGKDKNHGNEALLRMVNFLYDTDDKHIPELTRIPLQTAQPLALGMTLDSIFDEDVQDGTTSLSQKLRLYYFRLMRSVGGVHLGRGIRLAEEQAAAETEKAEELELGGE